MEEGNFSPRPPPATGRHAHTPSRRHRTHPLARRIGMTTDDTTTTTRMARERTERRPPSLGSTRRIDKTGIQGGPSPRNILRRSSTLEDLSAAPTQTNSAGADAQPPAHCTTPPQGRFDDGTRRLESGREHDGVVRDRTDVAGWLCHHRWQLLGCCEARRCDPNWTPLSTDWPVACSSAARAKAILEGIGVAGPSKRLDGGLVTGTHVLLAETRTTWGSGGEFGKHTATIPQTGEEADPPPRPGEEACQSGASDLAHAGLGTLVHPEGDAPPEFMWILRAAWITSHSLQRLLIARGGLVVRMRVLRLSVFAPKAHVSGRSCSSHGSHRPT